MRIVRTTLAAALILSATALAQVAPPATPPVTQQPSPAPPVSPPPPGGAGSGVPVVPAPVVPPVPLGARTFTAPTGIIFNVVRPERVVDFEMVIGYLQAAFEKSTDAGVRAQAQGWRVFKSTEPGPNATVLYVFVLDPAVAGAEYGLGRILSDAYPDQIQEIWKLYTGALAGGGSLLNLTPVQPPPLPPPGAPPPVTTTPAPTPRPAPPAQP
jgi:hypothetical protein